MKLNDHVDFPGILDMSKYMMDEEQLQRLAQASNSSLDNTSTSTATSTSTSTTHLYSPQRMSSKGNDLAILDQVCIFLQI